MNEVRLSPSPPPSLARYIFHQLVFNLRRKNLMIFSTHRRDQWSIVADNCQLNCSIFRAHIARKLVWDNAMVDPSCYQPYILKDIQNVCCLVFDCSLGKFVIRCVGVCSLFFSSLLATFAVNALVAFLYYITDEAV